MKRFSVKTIQINVLHLDTNFKYKNYGEFFKNTNVV
jgi:hypothetical protein